jgi:hypothetical protein
MRATRVGTAATCRMAARGGCTARERGASRPLAGRRRAGRGLGLLVRRNTAPQGLQEIDGAARSDPTLPA